MRHEETEGTRIAIRALREFRNSVIDWCVSVIEGDVEVSKSLSDDQLNRLVELLQKEKEVT